ncbi:hypothetical protein BDA96_02G180600 [Sorghum bicolor]|uniref:Uncharacterized protein n=1 Tax=Sorghum bicolor TaxID=4558 RepID=A0A921UT83_SORBI|nr:hypothetical protein BDA96_02G180600 [Sorghum bicolor]
MLWAQMNLWVSLLILVRIRVTSLMMSRLRRSLARLMMCQLKPVRARMMALGREREEKRKVGQDELDIMNGMVKAVENVGAALKAPQHNEVHKDLYGCVMNCPGYSQEALMVALVYLLRNKAEGLCFVQMSEAHMILWLRGHLSNSMGP